MKIYKYLDYITELIYRKLMRFRLNNNKFSIISNDCWGGSVYLDLGIPYTSPTVNLFIYSSCYIKFIKDLEKYISLDLVFVDKSKYDVSNQHRKTKNKYYPIGMLDDIEIHFLHSKDNIDAQMKWNMRKERIDFNNLFFKFSDSHMIDSKDLLEFEKLPFKNKVIFVSKKYDGLNKYVLLNFFKKHGEVSDPFKYVWIYRLHFDFVKWINKG